jgi:hypothetical protein
MKAKMFFLSFTLFLLLSIGCECEEEKMVMPPITSVGAHTFGCYINGDMFVHPKRKFVGQFGHSSLYADLKPSDLHVYSYDFNNRYISIVDSCVEVGKINRPKSAVYRDEMNARFVMEDDLEGEIILSRFDPYNQIVSGTFSFSARNEKTDSIVTISEGRFDIKLYSKKQQE